MKVRQSIVNPNKNSIMMFTEKLPYENVERSSDLQMHRKPYMSSAQSCTLDRQRNTPKKLVWTRMCTGSSYYGHWNQFGFNGHGIYRFPDGLTYDGELKDGHFHGEGTLTFPDGNVIMGHWEMGINTYMNLRFVDGLEFKETDWDYCMSPDRRFAMDEFNALAPIGHHSVYPKHNNADNIPSGYYYTGEGFYDPVTHCLYERNNPAQKLRVPTDIEVDWILKNCAQAGKNFSTVRTDLLEDTDYEMM